MVELFIHIFAQMLTVVGGAMISARIIVGEQEMYPIWTTRMKNAFCVLLYIVLLFQLKIGGLL